MEGPVTRCLAEWREGDTSAMDRLVPLVYGELRSLARRQLARESATHTLSATALVHEVYLRLLRQRQIAAHDRQAFLLVAGAAMRRVLVDHARARRRLKRGSAQHVASLDDVEVPILSALEMEEVLAIDAALDALDARNARARQVIECRIFGGLTLEEAAHALDLSPKTVQRSWTTGLAWLRSAVGAAAGDTRA